MAETRTEMTQPEAGTAMDVPVTHGAAWNTLSLAHCVAGTRQDAGCDLIDTLLPTARLRGEAHQAAVQSIASKVCERACANCPIRQWNSGTAKGFEEN